jgi:hypothetical protein
LDLPEHLLEIAAAVGPDGGDGVVRALRAILGDNAPFDAGEVAVLGAVGFARWTLTDDDEALAGEDLLLHVAQRHEAIRLDHPGAMEPFPRTLESLSRRGLKSLLALPLSLSKSDSGEGALVLARHHGWAFVAAPHQALSRVAVMGGTCLNRARLLTAVCTQLDGLKQRAPAAGAEAEAARRELAAVRQENAALRRAAEEERTRAKRLDDRLGQVERERARLAEQLDKARGRRRDGNAPGTPEHPRGDE